MRNGSILRSWVWVGLAAPALSGCFLIAQGALTVVECQGVCTEAASSSSGDAANSGTPSSSSSGQGSASSTSSDSSSSNSSGQSTSSASNSSGQPSSSSMSSGTTSSGGCADYAWQGGCVRLQPYGALPALRRSSTGNTEPV